MEENIRKPQKGIFKKFSTFAVCASLAVSGVLLTAVESPLNDSGQVGLTNEAHAGLGSGGTGGSGGGSAGYDDAYWIDASPGTVAYGKLKNGVIQNVPSQFWNDSVCVDSRATIVILIPAGVDYNDAAYSPTWTLDLMGTGNGANDTVQHRDGGWAVNRIMSSSGESYSRVYSEFKGKNLVCGNNPILTSEMYTNYNVGSANEAKQTVTRKAVHTNIVTVAPQPIRDANNALSTNDIIGVDNLNSQTATQLTDFGKVYNDIENQKTSIGNNTDTNLSAQWKNKIQTATDNERTQVSLNAKNKAGIAEGGVLNISETQKNAVITLSTVPIKWQVRKRTYQQQTRYGAHYAYVNDSGWQNVSGNIASPSTLVWCGANSYCGKTNNASERNRYKGAGASSWYTYDNNATVNMDTSPNTGFWQMLLVHCNQEEFNKLKTELGANAIAETTGGEGNGTAGVLHTVKYTSAQDARDKNGGALPVGDSSATTAARKASGSLGFYDKECSFACIADPQGAGASASNDAVNNIKYTTEKNDKGSLWGAVYEDSEGAVDGNLLGMFRDNKDREVRVNVRYPESAGNISYDGHAARTTTVTNWDKGTPGTIPTFDADEKAKNRGGIFTVVGKDGNNIFGTGEVKTQRNWDSGAFKSPHGAVVPYHMNKLNIKGSWASERDLPTILNIKWEYAPNITTNQIPTEGIGFDNSGNKIITGMTSQTSAIEGKCYAQFGETDKPSIDTTALFQQNTGTGSTNSLDNGILGAGGSKDTAKLDQLNLVTNFVRSTVE